MLVAKESRFENVLSCDDSYGEGLDFHFMFCSSQAQAQHLAQQFNEKLATIPGVTDSTPRIVFLECLVYVLEDPIVGKLDVLVEKMLDPVKYMKWNTNNGYVVGQEQEKELVNASEQPFAPLMQIQGNLTRKSICHHFVLCS